MERVDDRMDFWWFRQGPSKDMGNQFSVRWTGKIIPNKTGSHTFGLSNTGKSRLYIDGKLILENNTERLSGKSEIMTETAEIEFQEGKPHDIQIEFIRLPYQNFGHIKSLSPIRHLLKKTNNSTKPLSWQGKLMSLLSLLECLRTMKRKVETDPI